ncbi:organelle RRM domain-containing protein 6, chloroplastic [Arachis duranensis]|uniref:Organelle RRM domain-containing protein 6, chloroplastic n=1 Tax=Arachis duranensis TaxID=130453 RepID=A0A6P4DJB2_ARADU|nr:organelle RRM domain-containing protein 6, chloroplastic [Arachis duranensis]
MANIANSIVFGGVVGVAAQLPQSPFPSLPVSNSPIFTQKRKLYLNCSKTNRITIPFPSSSSSSSSPFSSKCCCYVLACLPQPHASDSSSSSTSSNSNSKPSSSSAAPPSTKLYVSGLSFRTTEESLRNAFMNFGQVLEVNLVMDKIANRPRGFAFLRYATEQESLKAIEGMHGKFLDGRVIFVEVAKPRSELRQRQNTRY